MTKKDLSNLNPDFMASVDTEMWQAYYRHSFGKLFLLLMKLTYSYFRPNYVLTLRAAYHSAFAAIIFRKTKGNENKKAVTEHLEKFYKLLSGYNMQPFDYKKAAELELQWWLVDRYPKRYEFSRATALAEAMAVVYNVKSEKLRKYGQKRAEAMELIGEHHYNVKVTPNWNNIKSLLLESYQALTDAIH